MAAYFEAGKNEDDKKSITNYNWFIKSYSMAWSENYDVKIYVSYWWTKIEQGIGG